MTYGSVQDPKAKLGVESKYLSTTPRYMFLIRSHDRAYLKFPHETRNRIVGYRYIR
jgi:hypothetical protein